MDKPAKSIGLFDTPNQPGEEDPVLAMAAEDHLQPKEVGRIGQSGRGKMKAGVLRVWLRRE